MTVPPLLEGNLDFLMCQPHGSDELTYLPWTLVLSQLQSFEFTIPLGHLYTEPIHNINDLLYTYIHVHVLHM